MVSVKKKVWIDIVNSPQVLFFKPIIDRLKKDHEIIITARKHSQTLDLLDMYNIKYTVIGAHAGKSKLKKALTWFKRIHDMYKFAKGKKIDCAVVHQSPYCMFPAWLLGIRKRVFIFDNETAKLQNRISMPFATHLICPEAITAKKMYFKKLIKYHGLKESVYIKKVNVKSEGYVLMRPEPWSAAYYNAGEDVLVPTINRLLNDWKIVLIPRDDKQRKFYSEKFGKKITIPTKMIPAAELIGKATVVIGAGGSMNREAVVLGIPVISTYKGKLLAVDRWLINKGLMYHTSDINTDYIKSCIKNHKEMHFYSALDNIVELIR
jgi:predicted glycosyltransferase